jgi:hypothetical protein
MIEQKRSASAAECIAHLEAGGLLATGDPDHIEFLRYEIWRNTFQPSAPLAKHLGGYGWGSALGTPEQRLKRILDEPWKWVCVPPCTTVEESDALARKALEAVGHYEDYEWAWEVGEEREPNVTP